MHERRVRDGGAEVEMLRRSRADALRAAFALLQARQFEEAERAAAPWAGDPDGGLLHALALAGSGAAEAAAPLLAGIAERNPGRDHPVQDLLKLLPAGAGVAHLRAALRLRPDDWRLLTALGVALSDCGPMDEAVEAFTRVTALRTGDPISWSNLGKAYAAECRFTAGEAAFDRALQLAPADAQIAYNRSVLLLKAGRLDEGWAAFRIRHALPGRPPALPGARLDTLEVAGRTVLLTQDEGLGDTLQFIRYATLLAERGARVVARLPDALARLIRTAPGVAEVVTGRVLPRYDAWCPLLDLPGLFGTTLRTIPGGVPYLHPIAHSSSPVLTRGSTVPEHAAGRTMGPRVKPGGHEVSRRILGLVWAGDPRGLLDHQRSLPVDALTPLRDVPGVRWVSLQKGVTPPGWMSNPMPGVQDFADTAAIVSGLDLVVSADTAVAHLAAALGKPVILMDRYDNCWRWLSGREDSPWYPGLRIIRQTSPGDWAGVVERAAALSAAR